MHKKCCEDSCHGKAECWECRRCASCCPRLRAMQKPPPCRPSRDTFSYPPPPRPWPKYGESALGYWPHRLMAQAAEIAVLRRERDEYREMVERSQSDPVLAAMICVYCEDKIGARACVTECQPSDKTYHTDPCWGLLQQERAEQAVAERDRLATLIRWTLGESPDGMPDFPHRPEKIQGKPHPLYWWRTELRRMFNAALADAPAGQEDTHE